MFWKQKQKPPPTNYSPFAPALGALPTPPLQWSTMSTSHMGSMWGSPSVPSGLAQQMGASMAAATKALSPEPTTTPEMQYGLIGYRLYSLDSELYLFGVRGERQEKNVSEQAKHSASFEEEIMARMHGLDPPRRSHLAPAWDCLCGFAAFFWPTSLDEPVWGQALAEVQAEGRTVVCAKGWRAERIRLNRLWVACSIVPNEALRILEERYEVPVEVLK